MPGPFGTVRKPQTEGAWIKIGPKRYEHVSGQRVSYDHNRFRWEVEANGDLYRTLTDAQHAAEKLAPARWF